MAISTVVLVVLGFLLAPSSVSQGAILGMLPFAAVLAIIGLGQMLVVQQGGIDLSVPGAVSLAVVLATHIPNENDGAAPAGGPRRLRVGHRRRPAQRLHGRSARPQPDHRHPRHQRAAVRCRARHLGRHPAHDHASARARSPAAARSASRTPCCSRSGSSSLVMVLVKKTVAGRRFEAVGASPAAARATGLRYRTHRGAAYVWAQLLFATAGILLAGIIDQPTAFQGNSYLLTVGRGRRPRRHVAARRSRLPRRHRRRRPVPQPARAVRARAGRAVRRAHPGRRPRRSPSASPSTPSTGPPSRRRLVGSTEDRGARRPPENPRSPGAGRTKRNTGDAARRPDTEENMNYRRISAAVAAVGLAALVLAGCSGDSGGGDDSGGVRRRRGEGAPAWCGPEETVVGLLDGFGGNSWRLVTTASGKDEADKCPSVDGLPLRRRAGRHAEGHLRHPGHGRLGRQRDRRLPRRRRGDASGAAQRLRGGRRDGALPRRPGRRGRRGLRRCTSEPTSSPTARQLGRLDQGELPRRRQHPLPQRPGRQQPGHRRARGLRVRPRPDDKYDYHRRAAVRGHQLGPGADAAGADRSHREVRPDRRDRLRLRPVAGRCAAGVREERTLHPARWPPPTATSWPASGRRRRRPTRTSSCSPSRPATTTSGSAMQYAVAGPPAASIPPTDAFQAADLRELRHGRPEPGAVPRRPSRRHLPVRPDVAPRTRPRCSSSATAVEPASRVAARRCRPGRPNPTPKSHRPE